jgi:hypothetical protein
MERMRTLLDQIRKREKDATRCLRLVGGPLFAALTSPTTAAAAVEDGFRGVSLLEVWSWLSYTFASVFALWEGE